MTGSIHDVQLCTVKHMKKRSGKNELDKPSVLVMAPTANAAFLIDGKTIDSALGIHMEKGKFTHTTVPKMSQMAFNYEEICLITCDGISMVGTNKFVEINRMLRKLITCIYGSYKLYGSGGFSPTPSVNDRYVFQTASSAAPNHWQENMEIYYLDKKMHCADDIDFAQLCDRVGKGEITPEDEKYMNRRIRQFPKNSTMTTLQTEK